MTVNTHINCVHVTQVMNTTKSGYESEDDLVEEWRQDQQQDSAVAVGSNFLEDPVLRSLLSTSFDVDIKKPYQDEVRFDAAMSKVKAEVFEPSPEAAGAGGHSEEKHGPGGTGGKSQSSSGLVSHSPEDHQTLLVTSLLMTRSATGAVGHSTGGHGHKLDRSVSASTDVGGGGGGGGSSGGVQRSRAEVKGIRFYTNQDVALGEDSIRTC